MTVADFAMRVTNPAYPPDRVTPGALARLLSEDWGQMTSAARSSNSHVSNLARWEKIARESNPHLSDDQVTRLAQKLKDAHYKRMQQLSVQARRAARGLVQLAAESGDLPEPADDE